MGNKEKQKVREEIVIKCLYEALRYAKHTHGFRREKHLKKDEIIKFYTNIDNFDFNVNLEKDDKIIKAILLDLITIEKVWRILELNRNRASKHSIEHCVNFVRWTEQDKGTNERDDFDKNNCDYEKVYKVNVDDSHDVTITKIGRSCFACKSDKTFVVNNDANPDVLSGNFVLMCFNCGAIHTTCLDGDENKRLQNKFAKKWTKK